ncbi:DUF6526 family protein [Siphonobacter sp. SORGH_AS_1065]|uniref:DUF6526 family protein n=1 Tax=Siphonobacter sp. SORGH_AS_1065 TaxID=3041795 RepID=UPI00278252BE|nr:DUF6526 family protein [Siphonobacter sp. SORGH_AS_1065]MDQ1089663.1 hypothetical protein [Siphonobacter sp. SORGH_AS_1065]
MKTQNYKNHVQYYPPHHFVFYPVVLFLMGVGLYMSITEHSFLWGFVTTQVAVITWLAFMLRQHYALGNQDRIVRLEMRLRYYMLTHESFESFESQLSIQQIAALRFASDEELVPLLKRAIRENLSPDQIKRSIQNWQADEMRL